MSMRDDTLLLRRYELQGDVSVSSPAFDLQPSTTQGDPGALALPQPPILNRSVQSVYDARPSFTREFWLAQENDAVPTSGNENLFVFTDFTFRVPDGYVGVLRRFRITIQDSAEGSRGFYALVLRNGVPVVDFQALSGPVSDHTSGIPVWVTDNASTPRVARDITGQFMDYYLEVQPGGSFGLRLVNNTEGLTDQVLVEVTGQFIRSDNVPPELAVATAPPIQPIVAATPAEAARIGYVAMK